MQPLYTGLDIKTKDKINILQKNVSNAVKNLNNVTTMYSTNFGLDALWVAIMALVVAIITLITTILLN